MSKVGVDTGAVFNKIGDAGINQAIDFVLDVGAVQNLAAHTVDDFAVAIDDVVILDDVLAGVKVEALNAFLSGLQGLRDGAVLDGHIFVHAESGHNHGNAVALENAHQVIFTADEELGGAGVALTAATATELVVHAARVVAFGADND